MTVHLHEQSHASIASLDDARRLDAIDPLGRFRERFCLPLDEAGEPLVYFTGNSLGLQPRDTRQAIEEELAAWAAHGVEAHFGAARPWFSYDEPLREPLARLVGARSDEVALMNSLTTNLHLLMVSFYRPTRERFRIVIEAGAFPSDRYAVASQACFHGFDPHEAVVELAPRPGEPTLRTEDIEAWLAEHGERVALVLLGGVNYLTGQAFDLQRITRAAHAAGALVGFDLAHAAGNLELALHDHDVDFAAWCSYKYLNGGPGAIAAIFVHERHGQRPDLPRFAGWWGNDPQVRFAMPHAFTPRSGAGGWQLSNVSVLSMAPLRVSLELFDEATMSALARRSHALTTLLFERVSRLERVTVLTPSDPVQRGAQLSLRIAGGGHGDVPIARLLHDRLRERGIVCDFRTPDVLRMAPVPLYNTFAEVWRAAETLAELLDEAPT